jgi:hypothetical protein
MLCSGDQAPGKQRKTNIIGNPSKRKGSSKRGGHSGSDTSTALQRALTSGNIPESRSTAFIGEINKSISFIKKVEPINIDSF